MGCALRELACRLPPVLQQVDNDRSRCLLSCSASLSIQAAMLRCSHSVTSDSLQPHGLQPSRLPCPWEILQARILEWVARPSSRGSSQPEIEPWSPTIQAGSLPSEPPGKPKNTGVGSLSLLQGIFPTQESNWGLLHCRQILYQLSYQGSPQAAVISSKTL